MKCAVESCQTCLNWAQIDVVTIDCLDKRKKTHIYFCHSELANSLSSSFSCLLPPRICHISTFSENNISCVYGSTFCKHLFVLTVAVVGPPKSFIATVMTPIWRKITSFTPALTEELINALHQSQQQHVHTSVHFYSTYMPFTMELSNQYHTELLPLLPPRSSKYLYFPSICSISNNKRLHLEHRLPETCATTSSF